jgi:uncharacterized membrane protein YcjF (UPF0283 family)
MAKNEGEMPEVKQEKSEEKKKFFPKLTILFSLAVIAAAVLSSFNVFQFPKSVINIVLLLAGLWLLKLGIGKGVYGKRKEVLKKYI